MNKGYLCLITLFSLFLTSCGQHNAAVTELFPVRIGAKYGFIDRTGKMVIDTQYAEVSCFEDGLALAATQGAKKEWGYIDKTGKFVVAPAFTDGTAFSEATAFVVSEDGEPEAIDAGGTVKFTVKDAEGVENYREGLAAFSVVGATGERWGFLDKEGKVKIRPVYVGVGFFSNGLCAALNDDGKWGFINKDGAVVIDFQFDNTSEFENGIAKVISGGKWGIIDNRGKYLITPKYASIDLDGEKCIIGQDDKFGWVDKNGKMIVAPQFTDAFPFNQDKFAAVRTAEKWGYIDAAGTMVIPAQFDFAFGFDGDMAPVRVKDKLGFINREGKTIINPQYDDLSMDYFLRSFARTSSYAGILTNKNAPRHIGYKWLTRFYHLDFEKEADISTEETKALLGQFASLTGLMPDSSKLEMRKIRVAIKDSKEDGDKAVVTYATSDNNKDQLLYLVKQNGKWLVQFSKNDVQGEEAKGHHGQL